jgi:hypothetical protein
MAKRDANMDAAMLKWLTDKFKPLVGKTVAGVAYDPAEGYVGLRLDDGTIVWSLRDDEDNGPGAFDIRPPDKTIPYTPDEVAQIAEH